MSSSGRAGAVAFALLVVLAIAAVPAGARLGAPALPAARQFEPDTVVMDVTVGAHGNAHWQISYLVRLDDQNTTDAFDSLAADVRANRSAYADRFAVRLQGTLSAAENATGRQMAIRNVTVDTTRQNITRSYGVLTYGFDWTNFAAANGTTIRAGDAVGGLYLDSTTSFTVRWPDGYRLASVQPRPDQTTNNSVTWRGQTAFAAAEPRVVVSSTPPPPTPGQTGGGGGPPWLALLGLLVALGAIAGLGWWWRRRQPERSAPASAPAEPPEELLSNEERVLRLVREHGGRLKQQRIVEELGWTDAKTSQVVGDLREAGELEGFRLGRENVLRLPEADDAPAEDDDR